MPKKSPPQEPIKVYCSECRHFTSDTSGMSVSCTGEYFMGTCYNGITDGTKKVFADKARICLKYARK